MYLKTNIDQFFLVDIQNHVTQNSKVNSNKVLTSVEIGITASKAT